MGRVADAAGHGIAGATVHLIEEHQGRLSPSGRVHTRVVGRTRTDPQGEFSFQARTSTDRGGPYHVVRATWRGVQRTVIVERPELVEVRMGPTRIVQLDVQCTAPRMTEGPRIGVRWEGDWASQYWMQLAAIPVAPARGRARLLPIAEVSEERFSRRVRPGTTRFAARLHLPVGRSTLTIEGACGVETRTVDIPADGDVPAIQVVLTHPDGDGAEEAADRAAVEAVIDGVVHDDSAPRGGR